MRDVGRIDGILERIGSVWKMFPDLRLGQLILNIARDPALYYIDDEALASAIENYYFINKPE